MPTYEYECTKCGKQWERFQSIKAQPERECPKCGRATARRKVGIGFAILSGSRSGNGGEEGAGAGATERAGGAAASATKPGDPGAKDAGTGAAAGGAAGAAAATPTDAAKASDSASKSTAEGKLNSTHPARDGRGAGNLRDAIARQRAAAARSQGAPGAGSTPRAKGAHGASGAAKGVKRANAPKRGKR
jgi:putative FmdB family regulatory protein